MPIQAQAKAKAPRAKKPLGFRLRDDDSPVVAPDAAPKAVATPLSDAEAKALAARLPPLPALPDDAKAFSFPAKSLAAPRAGKTVDEGFPPRASAPPPAAAPTAPLAIERRSPEGDVSIAGTLSVTFSQPMVAVGTLGDVEATSPPVRLTPAPRGKWQWLGARTLTFRPEPRFAMATDYAVEIPAGTTAMNGAKLPAAVRWTFSTPAPKLLRTFPSGKSVSRTPLLFAEIDQDVDPAALLPSFVVKDAKLRLATAGEIEDEPNVQALVASALPKRAIVFRPTAPLSADALVSVALRAGARSLEGPRPTSAEQGFSFTTHGALRVAKTECGYHGACHPADAVEITLSNTIDKKRFDAKLVRIVPDVASANVSLSNDTIWIHGATKAHQHYSVVLDGAITDEFGQTLGKEARVSFDVNAAEPVLFEPEDEMIVLDPGAPRRYDLYSINEPALHVQLYRVTPEDWPAYEAYRSDRKKYPTPPGKVVFDSKPTAANNDTLTRTTIELAPALTKDLGHALLVADDGRDRQVSVWIQSTQLGLSAFTEPDRVTGWVTRLRDGASVSGATVGLLGLGTATSDAGGLATVPLDARASTALFAKKDGDVVFAPERYGRFTRAERNDAIRWLVFDDRGMYRPGETAHLKGWLRRATAGRNGDLDRVAGVVSYVASDPRGQELAKGKVTLDELGGFDLALKVPPGANTGYAGLQFRLEGSKAGSADHYQRVSIAEFRRPEFEVRAKTEGAPLFAGGHGVATVNAAYYAGGGLPDAKTEWQVSRTRGSFAPPHRSDYRFGPADERADDSGSASWKSQTDASGAHRLRVDFEPSDPPYPMHLELSASVEDKNHQEWSAETSMLVHPADTYVGLKLPHGFVREGDPIAVDLVTTDLDGKAREARPIAVSAGRLEYDDDDDEEKIVDVVSANVASGADGTAHATLAVKHAGLWRVWAIVTDASGRRNQSAITVWVAGDEMTVGGKHLDPSKVTLVTDRTSYEPGEEAEVLVVAPFLPAEGVLTVRRQGIVKLERFTLTKPSQTLKVKLEEAHVPNVEIGVSFVGAAKDGHPAYGEGTIALKVLPTSRRLAVTVAPRDRVLEPGGKTSIDVEVKDASGKPAPNAKVALIVADEAVLALAGYTLPDPIAFFYEPRGIDVRAFGMRERVIYRPFDPDKASPNGDRDADGIPDNLDKCPNEPETYNGFEDGDGCPDRARVVVESNNIQILQAKIITRKNFSPLALFSPRVAVDGAGHATVPLTLPDNLTRYRIMAVVADGDRRFGASESTLTARRPLMVRPSPPRFFSFGDRFELPVLVQNQTDQPASASVLVRASNATLNGAVAKKITVPPNDRVEVRFDVASAKAGVARFQIAAEAGKATDAAEIAVPVHTPATSEAFATYGELDEGTTAQPVKAPSDVIPGFGALEVTTSSTALEALTDAVLYLVKYPYECAEQVASRILAIAGLRDVLASFQAEGLPTAKALDASVKSDLERLAHEQHEDGGWSFWADGDSWPYLTVHVAHALVRAKEKGYAVDAAMLEHARDYLRDVEKNTPAWYPPEDRRAIGAYAIYVRKRMGDADPSRAKQLWKDGLTVEGAGWVWPTLASEPEGDTVRRFVSNQVTETADAAHFATAYRDGAHLLLSSDRRADAIVLEALIGLTPQATIIPKLVKGLLGHRTAGHWQSTQENAFVLLALARYFETFEKATPDFVARAWLGDQFLGEHAFRGRTTERSRLAIPIDRVTTGNLTLAKEGPGRLYFRVGMSYAPKSLDVPPSDHGFVVTRAYEAIDRADDVTRDHDGWHMRAGSRVRVRLSMVAPSRRYHVALTDPLPAGLEPMNAMLAVTGPIPHDAKGEEHRWWVEHENLRDDRVEAFTSLLWEGVHEYVYVARATTVGVFVAGAPKAEEMYAPETFGRGASERVTVEAR